MFTSCPSSAIANPLPNILNLTEQLLYTDGKNPLYNGCPSAKVMISGGRYDYTFDDHRRLVAAKYSSSVKDEDFSTEYTYDEVANPRSVMRKGVVSVNSSGEASYGILDNLSYDYKGNQVQHIQQSGTGVDFYGRTGYALAHGDYTWNEAGLLNSDSSRGIRSTTYNHLGLPTQQKVSVNSLIAQTVMYTYSCEGQLLSVGGGKTRYYSGSRIFEGTDLLYSYFPGGYFDSSGKAHYTHTDYQGSIIAVTDSTGSVVQKVDYYPYGEPFREPSGQPMLFSGKERTSLADYHFGPRSLMSAALLWTAPDLKAHNFTLLSPYSYCAANPIAYIDPTGNIIQLIPAILGGAIAGACIDIGIQVTVNMAIKDNSFADALKEVDFVSVGKSAITGAFTGIFSNISKVTTAVNTIRNIKQSMPVIETGLEMVDAAVDYSDKEGWSVVACGENPKELTDAFLDFGAAGASKLGANKVVNWSRKEAAKEVKSSVFHTYTKEEKEFAKKVQKATESTTFESSVTLWSDFSTQGIVENEKNKHK